MQVIGLCRFSYPGYGGFQIEHESLEQRIAFLYSAERLEERFRFFETLTLPSIRAQTDPDFTFLVVIGEGLPQIHRDRLASLVADVPQIVLQAHPPGPHRAVMKEAVNSVRLPSRAPCLQFRLDDDDAVAVSFVGRLRRTAAQVAGMMEDHRHIALEFNRGFVVKPGPEGLAAAPIHQPFWTAGLALMFRPQVNLTVMNFGHTRVPQKMPAVTLPDDIMMLRGHNDFNDSRQGAGAKPVRLAPLDAEGEAQFRQIFNIDANHVRRVFRGDSVPGKS